MGVNIEGRCVVCNGYMHCQTCGLGFGEFMACEEPDCGPIDCSACRNRPAVPAVEPEEKTP
jgi:hypothetical protein